MVSTGISGSTTCAAASQARRRRSASLSMRGHHVAPGKVRCSDCSSLRRWPRCSLCRPSRPPCCIQSFFGSASVASLTTLGDRLQPLRVQCRGIDRDAGIDQAALAVVDVEHLAGIGPEIVDRGSARGVAFLGAVAEPDHPFRRMADVIGAFLFGLRRDRGQRRDRSIASSRANRDRRTPSRRTAAPWCGRNRRSAARPAADCGTA